MCDGKLSSTTDGMSRENSYSSLPETECEWDHLDTPPRSQPPKPPGHFAPTQPFDAVSHYQVAYPGGLEVRAGPGYAPLTGLVLAHGEVFEVSQKLVGTDSRIYLCLSNGQGWVFDDTNLVPHDPSVLQLPYTAQPMAAVPETLPVLFMPVAGAEAAPPVFPAVASPPAAPPCGELLASTPAVGAGSGAPERWYRVAYAGGINLRCDASIDAPYTGVTLQQTETFPVSEELQAPDGRIYLRLSDGRGWVFDDSALMPHDPAVVRGSWVQAQQQYLPVHQVPSDGIVQAGGPPIRRRLHAQPRGKRGGKRCSRRSKACSASASTPVEG